MVIVLIMNFRLVLIFFFDLRALAVTTLVLAVARVEPQKKNTAEDSMMIVPSIII